MSTGGKEGDLVLADVLRLPGQIGFDILEDDSGAANHGFLRSKGDVGGQQGINDVVLPQVYSYLVKRDLEGNIVGDVAESWEVSEDELTWTFHLRKGVKFHSGKELTAEDVKATYDRLLNKEDPVRYTQTMGFIDHCDIVDDYTINLVTLEPAGSMLASLTLRANTLLNKDYILYLEDPVGCYLNSRNETVILSAQVEDFNMTPVGIYDWPSIKVRAN